MTNRLPFRFLMNIKVSIHYERLQVKINTTNLDTTNHNTTKGSICELFDIVKCGGLRLLRLERYIIQIGMMNVFLSITDSVSLKHNIAPVPRGTEPLSRSLKAEASSVPGFVLFLISRGCSSPSLSITRSISLVSLSL